MAFTAYDTNTTTGDANSAFAQATKDRTDALNTHHLGSTAPASPTNGMIWVDNTSATAYVVKLYQNSAWVVLGDMPAQGNVDMGGNQLTDFIVEKLATGSLKTTEGILQYDTTVDVLSFGDGSNSYYTGKLNSDGSGFIDVQLSLSDDEATGPGTNPTAVTKSEFKGWQFDAVGEELLFHARVPTGWTAAHDLQLELTWALNQAETGGDDVNWDLDWSSLTPGTDVLSKAETSTTGTTAITTATDGAVYRTSIVIDHDDATNPVAVGDELKMVVGLTDVTDLTTPGGVVLIGARLKVPASNFDA